MNTNKRSGNRWTVNELLSLQREYELLEWTVGQIADKHQRSVEAILYKLESEGMISSWNEARGFDTQQYQKQYLQDDEELTITLEDDLVDDESEYNGDEGSEYDEEDQLADDDMSVEDDDCSEINKLSERVWNLETSVNEISTMMKQMFEQMVSKKSSKVKRAPLRKH
jgi:hypothetical protein